ncbi:MAG: T9SS type A sorting domain-containing protein, partial [Ignavibacteria bacterium]|nr:T9SS type A sorting domain-containing protein [Ignavibacteria bacterium]
LKQIDYNGNYKYYDLQNEVVIGVPKKFVLNQNYPNPFNPATKITFEIPKDEYISLRLYDISGREITSLINTNLSAGYHTVALNAADYNLSSGIYFYKLNSADYSVIKKMILLK